MSSTDGSRGALDVIGNEILLQLGMTPAQQVQFLAEMDRVRKSRAAAKWLAALLGGVGAHHIYLQQPRNAWLYAAFCWTGVPTLIAWWELRSLGERVDRYNALRARSIARRVNPKP